MYKVLYTRSNPEEDCQSAMKLTRKQIQKSASLFMTVLYNTPFHVPRTYHFRYLLYLHSTLYTTRVSNFIMPRVYHSSHRRYFTLLYTPTSYHSSLHNFSMSVFFTIDHIQNLYITLICVAPVLSCV